MHPAAGLDVGAGTGKFTTLLATTGATVVGVEPVDAMRAKIDALQLPTVRAVAGTAQAIPLPSGKLDAVVCAQAFHWFATREALDEFHRVLRPGGRLLIMEITKPQSRVGYLLLKGYMRGVVPLLARLVAKSSETPML